MLTVIKTFFSGAEVQLWAILSLVLLAGGVYVVHEIELRGENKIRAEDAKIVATENALKSEVERNAELQLQPVDVQLHTSLAAAPEPGISVRVCPPAARTQHGLPANASPGPGRADGPSGPAGPVAAGGLVQDPVGSNGPLQGVDIAPDTERLLAAADAEVAYWRAYYADCVRQKICKAGAGVAH